MLSPDQYTEAVRRRLYGTRARVLENQQVGPGLVLVGVRSENVMPTPVSTCVVVARTEFATAAMVHAGLGRAQGGAPGPGAAAPHPRPPHGAPPPHAPRPPRRPGPHPGPPAPPPDGFRRY